MGNATLSTIINNEAAIKVTGFIVPNPLVYVADYVSKSSQQNFKRYLVEFYLNNELDLPDDLGHDKCVQMWYTASNTANSNDMEAHGFYVLDETGTERFCTFSTPYADTIPISVFNGHKEGEIVTIKLPAKIRTCSNEDRDITVTLDILLNQRDYRYGSFGSFENCIQILLDRYNEIH